MYTYTSQHKTMIAKATLDEDVVMIQLQNKWMEMRPKSSQVVLISYHSRCSMRFRGISRR